MGKSRDEARPSPQTPEVPLARRALLRRAATVAAAGIGGVAATEMLTAGPASAAAGDPLTLGQANSSGGSPTTLASSTDDGASLEVGNSGLVANLRLPPVAVAASYGAQTGHTGDPGNVMQGGELINLTETVTDPKTGLPADADTLYWMAGDNSAGDLGNLAVVLTTATGSVFAPVSPTRLLDTRNSAGRARVQDHSVLNSSGQLIGGKSLVLQLDDLVFNAYAIHFNLTSTAQGGSGYLTVYPGPSLPTVSNLNFYKGVNIANSGLSPLSQTFTISIFASVTTHVLLDIQGWTLPDFSYLMGDGVGGDVATQVAPQAKGQKAKAATSSVLPGPMPTQEQEDEVRTRP